MQRSGQSLSGPRYDLPSEIVRYHQQSDSVHILENLRRFISHGVPRFPGCVGPIAASTGTFVPLRERKIRPTVQPEAAD
jgi:hypothetical protein